MKRMLKDWITAYLEYTDDTEPPELFRVFNAISAIAACLQRKVYLPWDFHNTYYPNMYVLLVGPSGARKGTSMAPAKSLLCDIGIIPISDAITSEALIQEIEANATTTSEPETNAPYVHCSVTIYSEEFTVFIGYNNNQLMANLCDWYDCKKGVWSYKTKHQGQNEINEVWVNMIGATTPELLRSTLPLDAIGGGLTARMILVYEERKAKTVVRSKITPELTALHDALVHDLTLILCLQGAFTVDDSFYNKYEKWYMNMEGNQPFDDDRFSGYLNRRTVHLRKLAMILSASRSDDMIITGDDFDRALELMKRTEKKMRYAFTGIGTNKDAAILTRVLQHIESIPPTANGNIICSRQSLYNQFVFDADKYVLDRVIISLMGMGAIDIVTLANGKEGVKYKGNPLNGK
jgi:hypothetical protein